MIDGQTGAKYAAQLANARIGDEAPVSWCTMNIARGGQLLPWLVLYNTSYVTTAPGGGCRNVLYFFHGWGLGTLSVCCIISKVIQVNHGDVPCWLPNECNQLKRNESRCRGGGGKSLPASSEVCGASTNGSQD